MATIIGENLGIRMDKDLKGEFHVMLTLQFTDKRDHEKEVVVALNEEEAKVFGKVFDTHLRMVMEKNVSQKN